LKKIQNIAVFVVLVVIISMLANTTIDNRRLKDTVEIQKSDIKFLSETIVEMNEKLKEYEGLQSKNEELSEKNEELIKENESLNNSIEQLTNDVNALNKTVSKAAQIGISRPDRVGVTPQFILSSRGSFDRIRNQDVLKNLSKGSYQYQQEEVSFDINDRNSWLDLGDWMVSLYTATVEECDSNPSFTASGSLVTPSFTVSVDKRYWKFGTIFYFEGLGFGIAADTGGAIKGKNRADFLVASKTFANLASGHRKVYLVYVPK